MIVTFDFPPIVLQHYHKRVTTSCSAYRKYLYGKWILDGTNFSPCRIGVNIHIISILTWDWAWTCPSPGEQECFQDLDLGINCIFPPDPGVTPIVSIVVDNSSNILITDIINIFNSVRIWSFKVLKHIWLCFNRKVTLSAWSEAARHRDLSDLEIILDSTRRLKELNFPNVCGLNRVLGVEHLKHFMFFLNFLILLWYQTICRKVLVGNQKYWWWLCVYGSCISIP